MLAQALAKHLPKPVEQVNIVHNTQDLRKPIVEVVRQQTTIRLVEPEKAPIYVAEQLGFKCQRCGAQTSPEKTVCTKCNTPRKGEARNEITATCYASDGSEQNVTYRRQEERIRVVADEPELALRAQDKKKRHVLLKANRKNFVQATGSSETELLGDVRHDPYGMHPEIGTPAYLRVVPGAVHEAHEGVLFIDELPHLGELQNYILTAMQEKKFPITSRNPHSGGASIKVDDVPCDFLFVAACNIKDVQNILSPLRSRILGNGYEILLNTHMEDTPQNRRLIARFTAQEIEKDGRIPHATREAVEALIEEGGKRARIIDDERNALTLRLRDLGGVIRLAGDLAVDEESEYIQEQHVKTAIEEAKPIEYQLQERYGSVLRGIEKDQIVSPEYGKIGSSYL
ncbi:MAG TPA: Lon protease family protein, partial [Candidatus Altiarchaeales archaeon]|nr:Lon protease family protein [Candidatus Altiarchaeales archaeon]